MSSRKTVNLKLHSWEAKDKVLRQEFVDNFNKIDSAFNASTGHNHTGEAGSGSKIDAQHILYKNSDAKSVLDKLFQSANSTLDYVADTIGEEFNPLGNAEDNSLYRYHNINTNYKNNMVTAIVDKGGIANNGYTMNDISRAIDEIPYHIEPQGTATEYDVAKGYSFYNETSVGFDGIGRVGVAPLNVDETYIPTTYNQYLDGFYENCTVKGDKNLIASNIKKGSAIFNVEGSFVSRDGYDSGDTLDETKFLSRDAYVTKKTYDIGNSAKSIVIYNDTTLIYSTNTTNQYSVNKDMVTINETPLFAASSYSTSYVITSKNIIIINRLLPSGDSNKVRTVALPSGAGTVVGCFLRADNSQFSFVTRGGIVYSLNKTNYTYTNVMLKAFNDASSGNIAQFNNITYFNYDEPSHKVLLYDSAQAAIIVLDTFDNMEYNYIKSSMNPESILSLYYTPNYIYRAYLSEGSCKIYRHEYNRNGGHNVLANISFNSTIKAVRIVNESEYLFFTADGKIYLYNINTKYKELINTSQFLPRYDESLFCYSGNDIVITGVTGTKKTDTINIGRKYHTLTIVHN